MKSLKKFTIVLCAAFCACFTLTFATTPMGTAEQQADFLHKLGVFEGTDKGFELDKTMTRAEAAAMVTRLLGAEEKAKAAKITMPFTDVPEWAAPYVNYLYEQKLTKGTSSTEYSPNEMITFKQYGTFMERLLNGDYYNEPASWVGGVLADDFMTIDYKLQNELLAQAYLLPCSRGTAVRLSVETLTQYKTPFNSLAQFLIDCGVFTLNDVIISAQGLYSQNFVLSDIVRVNDHNIRGLEGSGTKLFSVARELYAYSDGGFPVFVALADDYSGRWRAIAETEKSVFYCYVISSGVDVYDTNTEATVMAYDKSKQTSSSTGIILKSKPKLGLATFYSVQNDNTVYVGSVDGVLGFDRKTNEVTRLASNSVNSSHSTVPMLATDNGVFFIEDYIDGGNILFVDSSGKINRDFEYLANGSLRYRSKLISFDGTTLKYNVWQQVAMGMGGYVAYDVYKYSATARRVDCIGYMNLEGGGPGGGTIKSDAEEREIYTEEELARIAENQAAIDKGFNIPHSKQLP